MTVDIRTAAAMLYGLFLSDPIVGTIGAWISCTPAQGVEEISAELEHGYSYTQNGLVFTPDASGHYVTISKEA